MQISPSSPAEGQLYAYGYSLLSLPSLPEIDSWYSVAAFGLGNQQVDLQPQISKVFSFLISLAELGLQQYPVSSFAILPRIRQGVAENGSVSLTSPSWTTLLVPSTSSNMS